MLTLFDKETADANHLQGTLSIPPLAGNLACWATPWPHRYRFRTRAEAPRAIFAWINRYTTRRLHSSLGNIPPTEWEANYSQVQAAEQAA